MVKVKEYEKELRWTEIDTPKSEMVDDLHSHSRLSGITDNG